MIFWEKKLNTRFEAGAITWLAYQFQGEHHYTQYEIARMFQMSSSSIGTILIRLLEKPTNPRIYFDESDRENFFAVEESLGVL